MTKRLFILRLGHRLEQSLTENVVGIGWCNAPHLLETNSWDALKDQLRETYPDPYKDSARSLGNAAGSVWRFLKSIEPGDQVVVPVPGAFYVACIKSSPFYEKSGASDELDYAYRRRVVWETVKPVPRSHASNPLQRWMKARQTCVEADCDLLSDLNKALDRTSPIDFGSSVLDAAFDSVSKALHNAVNNRGLEQVVKQLAQASGAKAKMPSNNTGLLGDADVIATYDLKIGNMESTIEVAYQVKQHEGKTDGWGVQQLIDRMEASPSIVRGCLVTTAQKVSDQAQRLADENDILVLTERELVEWVLSVGLGALTDKH